MLLEIDTGGPTFQNVAGLYCRLAKRVHRRIIRAIQHEIGICTRTFYDTLIDVRAIVNSWRRRWIKSATIRISTVCSKP